MPKILKIPLYSKWTAPKKVSEIPGNAVEGPWNLFLGYLGTSWKPHWPHLKSLEVIPIDSCTKLPLFCFIF